MRIERLITLFCLSAVLGGCGGASSGAFAPSDAKVTSVEAAEPAPAAPPPPDMAYGAADKSEQDDFRVRPQMEVASKNGPQKAPPPAPPKQAPGGQNTTPAPSTEAGKGDGAKGTDDRRSPVLIYKAEFTMSVYEVQKSIDAVEALAKSTGGYLAVRDDRSITIRVPAGEFQGVVAELSKLGDVLNRNVTAEDVTAEYRDLEVQLQNALALRDRYAKLLDKAVKVEEALQIEEQLGRITGEIERIKGRLKLLHELAAYSTVTVRFSPRVDQQVQEGPFVLPLPWLGNLGLPRLLQLR